MGFFQPSIPSAPSGTSLTGQTVAITGANAGLGYEACLQHLRLGVSHLIMGVRSISLGECARHCLLDDSEVQSKNPKAQITILRIDLADYTSVIAFAKRLREVTPRLDVLYLNAGLNSAHWKTTADGHEELIQVHFLSNALLTFLVYPLVASTESPNGHIPRITWTGSVAQHFSGLANLAPCPPSILAYLADRSKYAAFNRYPDSKFLVAVFVRQIGRMLPLDVSKGQPVIVNNVCPGTVNTDIDLKHLPWYLRWIMALHRMVRGRSVAEGARTLLWAGEIMGHESHGGYISNNEISRVAPSASTVPGEAFARQLWQETLVECRRVTSGKDQGVLAQL